MARYALPHPIAALYRLAQSSHRASIRVGLHFRLVEGVVRFLALVQLAQALPLDFPARRVRRWLDCLRAPGTGKLAALLESTTRHVAERDQLFVTEMQSLLAGPWSETLSELIDRRNKLFHNDFQLAEKEAALLLADVQPLVREFLNGVAFLRDYRLGIVQGLRARADGFGYFWYGSVGLEETTKPIRLTGRSPLIEGLVTLLHPAADRALYLAPCFQWGITAGDRGAHLLWLAEIDADDDARYRHPVLRLERRHGFVDPCDPEGLTIDLEAVMSQRRGWPSVVETGLDHGTRLQMVDAHPPDDLEDRYRFIGKLGDGGMGTVWEAEDQALGRRCAVKLLRRELTQAPSALRRMLREGQLLARISHPGVVNVYHVDVASDDTPFIVMPLLEGEDLDSRLRRTGPMLLGEALHMMDQLLDAVDAIHGAGAVHRDLKPSNVMLTRGGPIVLDLGIASVADGARLTQTLERMGTPLYMAPEQWEGRASTRSDIYALGRLLFAVLVGRPPKRAGEALGERLEGLPPHVDAAYQRATSALPAERFASAAEMRAALAHAANEAEGAVIPGRATLPDVARTPIQYVSKSRDDFYAYYGHELEVARESIWFTSDGFNMANQASRQFAAFIEAKHRAALETGTEIHRFQIVRSMHLNWIPELIRIKRTYGDQYRVYLNERLDDIENFCVIDPSSPDVVVETMHPDILAEGQYSVAEFATFVHGNRELATRVMERMRRAIEHPGTLDASPHDLENLYDDLLEERLARLRRHARRLRSFTPDSLAEGSGIFDAEVIDLLLQQRS